MTELDKLKEDISFEKQIFFVLFAAGLAVIGWLFTAGFTASRVQALAAVVATILDSVALAIFARRIKNKINALERL